MAGTSLRPEVPVWYFCTLAMDTQCFQWDACIYYIYDTIREANVDHMFSRGYIYTLYLYRVVCLGVCFVVCFLVS